MQCELIYCGVVALQQGVAIHAFDFILYVLATMPDCLSHNMMQS